VETTPVADYVIKDIAIERKSVSDLKSSYNKQKNHLSTLEMRQYPKHILLVEGILEEDIYSSQNSRKTLSRLSLISRIRIPNTDHLHSQRRRHGKIHLRLSKKEKSPESSLRASKIFFSKEEQLQFILEGFPHVVQQKQNLLKKFHTLQNIFNA
jgi:ERCC4-type nuclease